MIPTVSPTYDDNGTPWFTGCSCGHAHVGIKRDPQDIAQVGAVCNGPCGIHDYDGPVYRSHAA